MVIAALGARPPKPPIAGVDSVKVYYAADAFVHNDELGKNVVIIGGSKVGTEPGLLLAQKGHNATVVRCGGRWLPTPPRSITGPCSGMCGRRSPISTSAMSLSPPFRGHLP